MIGLQTVYYVECVPTDFIVFLKSAFLCYFKILYCVNFFFRDQGWSNTLIQFCRLLLYFITGLCFAIVYYSKHQPRQTQNDDTPGDLSTTTHPSHSQPARIYLLSYFTTTAMTEEHSVGKCTLQPCLDELLFVFCG
jgi:hypothetical protein